MAEPAEPAAAIQADLEDAGGIGPFGNATGRGVRIAVIDSGVNARHPHIGAVAGGAAVTASGEIRQAIDAAADRLGHGTALMAAIQEKAPGADYFAVQVFHDAPRTTAATLLRAIDWCVEQRMDIINLSLGSTNPAHRDAFAQAADRAATAGCLLVAARDANGQFCYPGCLPAVLGVSLDRTCPRDRYRAETIGEETVFCASGYPRPAPRRASRAQSLRHQLRRRQPVSFCRTGVRGLR